MATSGGSRTAVSRYSKEDLRWWLDLNPSCSPKRPSYPGVPGREDGLKIGRSTRRSVLVTVLAAGVVLSGLIWLELSDERRGAIRPLCCMMGVREELVMG